MRTLTHQRPATPTLRRLGAIAAVVLTLSATVHATRPAPVSGAIVDPAVVVTESTIDGVGFPGAVGVDTYGRAYTVTSEHPEPDSGLPFIYTLRRFSRSGRPDTAYGPIEFGGASLAPAIVVAADGTLTVARFKDRDHRPTITYQRVDPTGQVTTIRSVGRPGHFVYGIGAFDLGDRLLSGIVLAPNEPSTTATALVLDVDTGEVVTEIVVPYVGDIVAVSPNAFALADGSLSIDGGAPAAVPVPPTHRLPRITDLMEAADAVIAVGSAEVGTGSAPPTSSARRPLFARYALDSPTIPSTVAIGQANRVITGLASNGIAVLEEPDPPGFTFGQPPPNADLEIARLHLATGQYTPVAATADGLGYGGRLRPTWVLRSDNSMTLLTRARSEQLYSYDLWGHPPTLPAPPVPPRIGSLTGQVERLYRAYFDRAPEPDGMLYWRTQRVQGRSLSNTSAAFATSPEFVATYGPLDNGQFIDLVYRNVLDRSPDAGGRAFWLGRMQAGMIRGAVMIGFSESAEFVTTTGTVRPAVGNEDQLRRLYWAYFNRAPDAAGLEYWMAEVQRSGLDAASGAFARSPEFNVTYGPLGDGQFVNLVYWNVLDRGPDAAGKAYWIGQLGAGRTRGQVMTAFSESAEFLLRTDSTPTGS